MYAQNRTTVIESFIFLFFQVFLSLFFPLTCNSLEIERCGVLQDKMKAAKSVQAFCLYHEVTTLNWRIFLTVSKEDLLCDYPEENDSVVMTAFNQMFVLSLLSSCLYQ